MSTVFMSRYMPCEQCGESVDRTDPSRHRCDPDRRADYAMFAMRHEIARFEHRWRDFLDRAHGRFEVWLAARQVRSSRDG